MNEHLTEDTLICATLALLSAAEREVVERHLRDCSACCAALGERQAHQAAFQTRLQAELHAAQPSSRMNFAAIAPAVRQSRRFAWLQRPWELTLDVAPAVAALAGVMLAIAGLLRNVTWPTVGLQPQLSASAPLTACLMLSVPIYTNYNRNRLQRRSEYWAWLVALLLWLGTAVMGLYEMLLVRDALMRAYLRFGPRSQQLIAQTQALSTWSVFLMGALWVVLVIGGGEYHYRHVGQRASWKVFAWTLAVQLVLLALPLIV